jgi:predicted acyltransferase
MPLSSSPRISSLDAFRGYTVAAMIMVNFPGSWDHIFPTLRHSEWNGLTFTDLVAPFFLFIVGVSITLAYGSRKAEGGPMGTTYRKILWRGLKIWLVGMALNLLPHFDIYNLRWTGTLHRISVVFVISAIVFLHTSWKQQAWICALLLLGYWMVMSTIPTPGEGRVLLEPGRNLAAWVDSRYLPGKMWEGTWDPEGILSTFPATATTFTGMLVGHLLSASMPDPLKINALMTAGVCSAITGYFLGLVFPVNENLWTSSFVLVTSGFAALVFGAMFYLADIRRWTSWTTPGVAFGANAITAYVLGDLLSLLFYGLQIGGKSMNQHAVKAMTAAGMDIRLASWCYALFFVGVVFLPVWIMYRRKIIIKL